MATDAITPISTAAPPSAPVAASAPAPQPAPVAAISPAPAVPAPAAPAPAPAAAPAPTPEAAAPTPASAPAAEPPTALGGEAPKPADKPADEKAPAAAEAKPAEGAAEPEKKDGQSDSPAPPSFEPWSLPEGLTLDQETTGKFTGLLGKFETDAKVDHAMVQALGQDLVNFHLAEIDALNQRTMTAWREAFTKQVKDWGDAFKADPEWGGNGYQTTVNDAREFINRFGGNVEQQNEVHKLMDDYGVGNNLAVIRLFANAMRQMRNPEMIAAQKLPAQDGTGRKSNVQKMYGGQAA